MRQRLRLSSKRLIVQFALAASLLCASTWATQGTGIPLTKRVLILSEMGLNAPASNFVIQQLEAALQRNPSFQTELYVENLETALFADEAVQREIQGWLQHKYRDRKIDVIVAVGPEPLQFVLRSRPRFFSDVPVVFSGILVNQVDKAALGPDYTGVFLQIDPRSTLDAALRLLPKTKRLVVLGGSSAYDRSVEAVVRAELKGYRTDLETSYLVDLPMKDVLARVRELSPDCVVLFTSFWQDAQGSRFINASVALPMIAAVSRVPVFGMADTYMGHGVVGGNAVQFAQTGGITAEIVSQILGGKSTREIPIVNAPSAYMFDWQQLRKYGLNGKDLPPGSVVLYRQPTLFELYRWRVIGGLGALAALMLATAYLAWQVRRRWRAERRLRALTGNLIEAQEQERKRVAREIHDDISQRLALLAIGLESTSQQVGRESADVSRRLQELWEEAIELGIDLHNISHHLHSSTLESLGFVSGVSALCREFTEKTGIKVTFVDAGVPEVNPEIALSIFRVIQEALRNVQKHSGAASVDVRLECDGETLRATVADRGKGFVSENGDHRSGLGMQSMKERIRFIGGRLQVHSELGKGTIIEAAVPLASRDSTADDHVYAVEG